MGWPILVAQGSFVGSTAFFLHLYRAGANQSVFPVIGTSVLEAPFKGGTMVPQPQILVGPLVVGASGELHLQGHWPTGLPSGFPLVLQFWFPTTGAPAGFAASSGVLITTP